MSWQMKMRRLENSLRRCSRALTEHDRLRELNYAIEDFEALQLELNGSPSVPASKFPDLFVSRSAVNAVAAALVRAVDSSDSYAGDDSLVKVIPETVVLEAVDRLKSL